jgi:hypothetical protein
MSVRDGGRADLATVQQLLALDGQTVEVDTLRAIEDPDGRLLDYEGEIGEATLIVSLEALGWTIHDDIEGEDYA